jgi:hypothetical protein
MIHRKILAGLALTALAASSAHAANITVRVSNLTGGIFYTPFLFVAHPATQHLFEIGKASSTEFAAMAEGGNIAPLAALVKQTGAQTVENPVALAGGPLIGPGMLAPGASVSADMTTTAANTNLSVVAMLLPTNDAFAGLDSWAIPTTPGTYTLFLNAYDNGSEANTELFGGVPGDVAVPGIPADPGGKRGRNGTGVVPASPNNLEPNVVHIHRGTVGDTDPNGGISDLDSRIHRWLNPVVRVTVTVK